MSKTRPPVSKWVRLLRKLSRRRHARQLRRQRLSSSAYSTRRSNIGSWGAEGPWVLQASKVRKRYKARKGNNHRKRNKAWKRKWIRENRKRGKVSKALPRQKKAGQSVTFLSLPPDVRAIMYGLLLVKDWSLDVFRNASSTYLKGAPKYVRRRKEWVQVQKYKNEPHPMPRGPLALLYVNRLIHEEAAQVLYGQNRFIAVKDTSFNYNSILSGFGKVNAGRIRKLEVGVPKVVKTGSLKETEFKRFLSFVCEDFSNLQSLVLTTTPKNNPDFQASRKFKRQCRGVLFTAAQITQWHPVLKKAMLSRTAKGRAFVELRVDFSPGSAVAPWKVEDEKQPDSSERKCVLLDSVKIRTMSWENLMGVDADIFALAATAPSSESANAGK
ncbi:hypothetical protein PV05_02761 [Exophiala xenobiotica]|uniref:F-box domain-containing protein n=1 Tax=Exophiala xenobiotica TaxID=348802 RepID=A0A0D2EU02_9EURO|nr:uncharacterized protein PV05_02761 [Exophiala xenobiotica]KIW58220.1 hypothetical protein PV05_02761 [Exophiala xenobiotica]